MKHYIANRHTGHIVRGSYADLNEAIRELKRWGFNYQVKLH